MPGSFPPMPGCETCLTHGMCVCWSDADQREFERVWNEGKPKSCQHIGVCSCPREAQHDGR